MPGVGSLQSVVTCSSPACPSLHGLAYLEPSMQVRLSSNSCSWTHGLWDPGTDRAALTVRTGRDEGQGASAQAVCPGDAAGRRDPGRLGAGWEDTAPGERHSEETVTGPRAAPAKAASSAASAPNTWS